MKIVKRKITELIAAEYNPRKINKVQEQDLKDSLTRFGLVDPIIININEERKNIVIGGHQRLRVWADLGNTEIDCNQLDLTLDKERELNIRLNKNGGSFDDELVKEYFDYEELTEWGFTPDELFDKEETTADGLIDDDEIPEVKESKVKQGDIWQLGEHRIMCGDSTSSNDVAKLMNGEKADMVFTDPPYNALKSWNKKETKSETRLNPNEWFANDNMSWEEFEQFIIKSFNNMTGHSLYICCDYRIYDIIKRNISLINYNLKHCIVWKKNIWGLGKRYRFQHEFIVYATKENNSPFYGDHSQSDVWEIDVDRKTKHKTPKPVELPLKAIKNSSEKNNLILDSFLGSGSTLIAAEKLNRKCYGMELDEKYCDLIIERWEQFTGLKAEKING
jgi:DNA modification methylase